MFRKRVFIFIGAISLVAVCYSAQGQDSLSRQNAGANKKLALATLDFTVDEVSAVENLADRVELSARLAGLLADKKPERCRHMLDALFDNILQAKQTEAQADEHTNADYDALAGRVIATAARFDAKLAEAYIAKYTALKAEAGTAAGTTSAPNGKLAAAFHLAVATELLEKNPALATTIAAKSLSYGVLPETLLFLVRLREKVAALADQLSATALRSVAARGAIDVNELLRLYSYFFSTAQVPFATRQEAGLEYLPRYAALITNQPINRASRDGYLRAVAQLLLAPQRGQRIITEQLTAGALGDYVLLKLVEPYLAGQLPSLIAPVAAQQLFLLDRLKPTQRATLVPSLEQWSAPRKQSIESTDDLDALIQHAAEARDATGQDRNYFKAIMLLLRQRKPEMALAVAEKLSPDTRQLIKPYIEYSAALLFIADKSLEQAERLARQDSDTGRRAYLYTLIAQHLIKEREDYGRASEFLSAAELLAAKLDAGEQAIALAGIAIVYARYDATRAAPLFLEVTQAATKIAGFTLDARVSRRFQFEGFTYFYELYGGELTLEKLLEQHARRNLNGALADVRRLDARLFRLQAIIALCRGALIG